MVFEDMIKNLEMGRLAWIVQVRWALIAIALSL